MQDKERLSRARSNLKEQESYSFETVIYRKKRQSAVSSNYQTEMRILNEMFQNKKIFLEIQEVGEMKKCLTAGLAVLLLLGEGLTGNAWEKTKDSREELVVGVSFKTLQQITQTAAEKGLSGKVAYVYGDPIGGSSVYTFRDGMQESLKDNEIEVVGELWAQDWDPEEAMSAAENWIAQYGDELKGILCMNDGMAGGVVQALENAGMAGQVMVCGQDCDLAALQRILAGTQVSTVLKSGSEYPELFVNACIDYYLGELTAEDFDSREKNCDGKEIPFMSYDSKVITIDNVDDAIEAGLYTYEEIYQK